MVILQIANITNDKFSGVSVVVPEYLRYQSKYVNLAFLNTTNAKITGIINQFNYQRSFKVVNLPKPFNKPDLVVFQEFYRKEYISISRELRDKNIPYLIIPHGELRKEAQETKKIKKYIANATVFKPFINGAIAIQCLSEREYENTLFGKSKFIIPNGVRIPERRKEVFSSDNIKFVYIGRLDYFVKGIDLLIEAIDSIREIFEDNKCILDIYGPDKIGRADHIQKLIKEANLDGFVKLHNPVFGEAKERILLDSDVFVQTSRFEGMPLGILEAMSYGIPCLITKGTSLGECVEQENAGWVAENTSESIANSFLKCIKEKGRFSDYGMNGRKCINDRFSWNEITTKTIEMYKNLIDRSKAL